MSLLRQRLAGFVYAVRFIREVFTIPDSVSVCCGVGKQENGAQEDDGTTALPMN